MVSFDEAFNLPPPEEPKVEIVRRPSPLEKRQEQLSSIRDDLFKKVTDIVDPMLQFAEFDPERPDVVPLCWRHFPEEEQKRRMRVARAAWQTKKEAPVALEHAAKIYLGIVRAQATEKAAPRSLNIAFVKVLSQPKNYDELEVER